MGIDVTWAMAPDELQGARGYWKGTAVYYDFPRGPASLGGQITMNGIDLGVQECHVHLETGERNKAHVTWELVLPNGREPFEEPLECRRHERADQASGLLPDALPRVRHVAGQEDERPRRCRRDLVLDPEAELTVEHVQPLVLRLVEMERRPVARGNLDLEDVRPVGALGAAELEDDDARRVPRARALARPENVCPHLR